MFKFIHILFIFWFFILSSCNSEATSDSSENRDINDVGMVTVDLTYPSEYIPEMDVYLLNVENKQMSRIRSVMNVSPVIFENVQPGRYVVYAVTVEKLQSAFDNEVESSDQSNAIGGYTANVERWDLLQFKVTRGEIKVEINDWDVNIPEQ